MRHSFPFARFLLSLVNRVLQRWKNPTNVSQSCSAFCETIIIIMLCAMCMHWIRFFCVHSNLNHSYRLLLSRARALSEHIFLFVIRIHSILFCSIFFLIFTEALPSDVMNPFAWPCCMECGFIPHNDDVASMHFVQWCNIRVFFRLTARKETWFPLCLPPRRLLLAT